MTDLYLNHFSAKGVPDFWLTAMKTNEVLSEEVSNLTALLSVLSSFNTLFFSFNTLFYDTD